MSDKDSQQKSQSIIEEIDALENIYLRCRSVFPTLTQELVGHREFTTAPYYLRRGFMAQIQTESPITSEFIEHNRQLGKWINENVIIRLYGILNYYGYFKKINY